MKHLNVRGLIPTLNWLFSFFMLLLMDLTEVFGPHFPVTLFLNLFKVQHCDILLIHTGAFHTQVLLLTV